MSRAFVREDYLKVDITFDPVLPAREVAIGWLSELPFEVFDSTENGLIVYAPNKFINPNELTQIKSKLQAIASVKWKESIVKTENWNAEWESDYEPVNIEGRAMVRAPFHAAPPSGLDIVIAPHMSFGTGHHDTTWLMIRTLLNIDVKGKKVLDMGCGTGVLAFTAMKLGASFVLAIDIEAGAHENTLANAALNGCANEDRLSVKCGDATLLKQHHHHDLILANINRNILLKDLKCYDQVLNAGGNIALSGFFTGDVPVLQAAVKHLGWESLEVSESDGWACILCVKTQL
jgi:ribosomal protein L11 methyltransferase